MRPGCSRSKREHPAYHGQVPPFSGPAIVCPVCTGDLTLERAARPDSTDDGAPRLLRCEQGHRFDAARQGYFNLLTGRGTVFEADTAAMVQARIDFLGRGHYRPLADAVCAAVEDRATSHPRILDAGAGTGYYLKSVMEHTSSPGAVAIDISKFALRRAARELAGTVCLVWDVWRPLPLADSSVDVLLNIFAPRNPDEFARTVAPGGLVVVVTPLPNHLEQIAESAGLLGIPPDKSRDVAQSLAENFTEVASTQVEYTMLLSALDITNVAVMGPAGHHGLRPATFDGPAETTVTAAFTVQAFRRRT